MLPEEVWHFQPSGEHLVKRGAEIANPIGNGALVEQALTISCISVSSPGLWRTIDKEGNTQRHYISGQKVILRVTKAVK